ncbi:MAG TPA: penicillin-binding protein 2, partial [Longimicrobiales bacterium]|nr:penicillin-binding protein 2 [Longimicrobiales bacterium]
MRSRDSLDRVGTFRRRVLLGAWLLGGLVLLGRSARVQILEGSEWSRRAAEQHRASTPIAAARGAIYDRNGVPLAVSRERWIVSVAPRELTDVAAARSALVEVLGISRVAAERVTDRSDPWHQVPGRYPAEAREALDGITGIYLERRLDRFYPHGELAGSLLGHVIDGEGRGGIEGAFDEILRGVPGRQVVGRGGKGQIPGEVFEVERPVPGGEIRLTIDLDLQEIAEEALARALEESGSEGGDLILADPRTGEILAMTSVRDGSSGALSTINTSYEPGSTLKPFTVAALLKTGAGSLEDSVETGVGYWRVAGRDLHDVGGHGTITLARALQVSSNIGVAKAAQALTPEQQYANLRDFGFGVLTGVGLAGEVGGSLPHPERWTGQSPASLAIGYEVSVTPLQMTMAYGALANGG